METSFDTKLRNYARIGLEYGLGFDHKIRPLYVEAYQLDDAHGFIPILAEMAYQYGVDYVDVRCGDPALQRAMLKHAPESHRLYVPSWITRRAEEIVEHDGARIALNGNALFGIMDDVDPRLPSAYQTAFMKANEPLTSRRMKMLQPWSILDVPSAAWAKKLNMSTSDLWEFLFEVSGASRQDGVEYARGVGSALHRRCAQLDRLGARTVRFRGDGTDLTVGLSSRARWLGGRKSTPDGTWFGPNWPSFEVYTTPDWHLTTGTVRVTMPVVLGGVVVEDLQLTFEKGRIIDFTARTGSEAFAALIKTDVGASQLGEVALVGLDAPLSKYSVPHYCTMLDENKRCHIAVGKAYPAALRGGSEASASELAVWGCNVSDVHQDIMISDETTTVDVFDDGGSRIARVMEEGRWLSDFA